MEDKVLNAIGKLTIEINEIKENLNKESYLQRIADVEGKISELSVKLSQLEKNVQNIITASNGFAEKLNALDNEWQENRELLVAERKRRAKISASARRNSGYEIVDEVGFGGRLRALRRKQNMQQADVSKVTLVPKSTIGAIEGFNLKYIAKEYLDALNKYFNYDFNQYVKKENEE